MTVRTREIVNQRLPKILFICCTALILVGSFLSGGLSANPLDTYGFTSRVIALGGAGTAAATDVDATYYNPAAVTRTPALSAGIGFLFADDFLSVNDESAELDPHVYYHIGLATNLPLGTFLEDRIFIGVAIGLPHDGLYDVDQPDDENVNFVFWDNRNRRLVLSGVLAAQVVDWLSVGVGTTLLPDVTGRVQADLTSEEGNNATRVEVDYNFAVTAGLLLEPLDWLAVGVTYRGQQYTEILMPVDVEVAAGVPPVLAEVVAPAYSLPHEVAVGVSVNPLESLLLAADATWYDYSTFRYSSPDVTVLDREGEALQESQRALVEFSDVVALRMGAEWAVLPEVLLRAGYGFIPSPVPPQHGVTNLLDATRNTISVGVGLDAPHTWLWEGVSRLALDIHGQFSLLESRAFEKDVFAPDNPGFPTISMSGGTFSMGFQARIWF